MFLTGCIPGPGKILGSVSEVFWFFLYVQLNWEESKTKPTQISAWIWNQIPLLSNLTRVSVFDYIKIDQKNKKGTFEIQYKQSQYMGDEEWMRQRKVSQKR